MIKTILIFTYLLISITCSSQGIEFFEGSWEEAKEKATSEEKLIFVDAYATWCGPCKRMAKTVFTNPQVGEYFNSQFISLKIDMEKTLGRNFGKEYPVTAYPTLYFINEKGEVLKRVVGGKNVEQFLSIGSSVAGSYDRSGDLAELYNAGNREYEIVLKYVKALNNANKSSLKVANDFLRGNESLTKEEKSIFIYEALTAADSRIFEMFIQEKSAIESLVGKESTNQKIEEACWRTIQNAIDFESMDLLAEAKLKMKTHFNKEYQAFSYNADYEYAKAKADINLLNSSALQIAKKVANKDAERLHDICNELLLYKSIDNSVVISSEKIAKMAVDNQPNSEYLFTYSKILSANNKNKKAIKVAEKALKMTDDAKQANQIEEWINSIQSK